MLSNVFLDSIILNDFSFGRFFLSKKNWEATQPIRSSHFDPKNLLNCNWLPTRDSPQMNAEFIFWGNTQFSQLADLMLLYNRTQLVVSLRHLLFVVHTSYYQIVPIPLDPSKLLVIKAATQGKTLWSCLKNMHMFECCSIRTKHQLISVANFAGFLYFNHQMVLHALFGKDVFQQFWC